MRIEFFFMAPNKDVWQQFARKYWIVKANQKIRTHIRNCTSCFKFVTTPHTPLMGDLPTERVSLSNPWDHTGVDFAGPFLIRAYVEALHRGA